MNNIFEYLMGWTTQRIYVQKRIEIRGDEVEKWRRIEDPACNIAL